MKIELNPLVKNAPQYIIDHKEFNRMMEIKKRVDRYDKHGIKKVEISQDMKTASFGKHKAERIKNEHIKGPFVIVFLMTDGQKTQDNDNYNLSGTLLFEEGDAARVYRDSMNDGFTDARFCDDTVMLMSIKTATGEKTYIKVEGEPTGFESWKFESTEATNEHNTQVISGYIDQMAEKFKLAKEDVYVVIQLLDC